MLNTGQEINRWTNTGAVPHPNITTTEQIQVEHTQSGHALIDGLSLTDCLWLQQLQQSPAMQEASSAVAQQKQARSVNFSSQTKIDVGSVPTVTTESGHAAVPLWSAGASDDLKEKAAQYGRDGLTKAPSHHHHKKGSDKLQYLASHGLEDWPDPNAQVPTPG